MRITLPSIMMRGISMILAAQAGLLYAKDDATTAAMFLVAGLVMVLIA